MWSAPEDGSDTALTHNATVRARAGFTVQPAVNHYNTREGSEGELDGAPTQRQWQPDTMRHLIEHRQKPWKPAAPAMRQTATIWKGVYPKSSGAKLAAHYKRELQGVCRRTTPEQYANVGSLLSTNRGNEMALLGSLSSMRPGSPASRTLLAGATAGTVRWSDQNLDLTQVSRFEPASHWSDRILHALEQRDEGAMREALASPGANVNECVRWGGKHRREGRGWGWDFEAYFGEAGGVEWGRGSGRDLGAVEGDSCLMLALKTGSPKLVLEVLEFGPDLSVRNSWGQTAADIAQKKGLDFLLPQEQASS